MERLTERSKKTSHENGVCCTHFRSKECNAVYGNCADNCKWEEEAWSKLVTYEDLEEQGLLLKLPCKLGDTVYEVQEIRKRIQPYTIISIHISRCSILFGWELKDGKGIYSTVNGFCDYAIGKTVFLTQEQAEQKLKEMEGKA